jgi:Collagen triple helix repeat (20 copies)
VTHCILGKCPSPAEITQGYKGERGLQGEKGQQGTQGRDGPKGTKGEFGYQVRVSFVNF